MRVFIYSVIFLMLSFSSCNKKTDYTYINTIEVINSTNAQIVFEIYNNASTNSIVIEPNGVYSYKITSDGSFSIPFTNSDSIKIEFINGKVKTDYNCYRLPQNIAANCLLDTISLYNFDQYETTLTNSFTAINRYMVSIKDSLESN